MSDVEFRHSIYKASKTRRAWGVECLNTFFAYTCIYEIQRDAKKRIQLIFSRTRFEPTTIEYNLLTDITITNILLHTIFHHVRAKFQTVFVRTKAFKITFKI